MLSFAQITGQTARKKKNPPNKTCFFLLVDFCYSQLISVYLFEKEMVEQSIVVIWILLSFFIAQNLKSVMVHFSSVKKYIYR